MNYTLFLLLSILTGLSVTPVVIMMAKSFNVVDVPDARKVHSEPVPCIGGLAIYLSVSLVFVFSIYTNKSVYTQLTENGVSLFVLYFALSMVFLIGFYDDIYRLRPLYKLLVQILAAFFVAASGMKIESLNIAGYFTINLGYFAYPITIFWIISIVNAVNLIDGLDGLAAGVCIFALLALTVLSYVFNQAVMLLLMVVLIGVLLSFLYYNFNPAKIFLGDCGSLSLGFIIATVSVININKSHDIVSLALPALALSVPILDTVFAMIRRASKRWGIMSPDRDHLHHRLLDMGLSHANVAVLVYVITFFATGIGTFMLITAGLNKILLIVSELIILIAAFEFIGVVKLQKIVSKVKQNIQISKSNKNNRKIFEKSFLQVNKAESFKQFWHAVLEAAKDMGFIQIRLTTLNSNGQENVLSWSLQENAKHIEDCRCFDFQFHLDTLKVPAKIDARINRDESLESAAHRIMMFGRLLDEYGNEVMVNQTDQELQS